MPTGCKYDVYNPGITQEKKVKRIVKILYYWQ